MFTYLKESSVDCRKLLNVSVRKTKTNLQLHKFDPKQSELEKAGRTGRAACSLCGYLSFVVISMN